MAESDARQLLLSALYKRSIDLGTDDVNWAFENPKTKAELTGWVREYLDSSTLLTSDEIDLYEAIKEQGSVVNTRIDTVPLQEFDIKDAIDSLKSSTAAIEKHSKALEAQRDALLTLNDEKTKNRDSSFSQKYSQESGKFLFAVDDLLHSTKEQLSEAEQHSARTTSIMNAVATERLAADDQVFEALTNLAPKISQPKSLPVEPVTIDKWTRALASFREQEIKARVDANLRGLGNRNSREFADEPASALKVELEDLQNELQTLRDEIESVVQMVIGHEIRDPLLKNVQALESHSRQTRNGWSSYLLSTLQHLVDQLEAMNDQITDIRSYNGVLQEVQTMLATTEAEITQQQAHQDEVTTRSTGPGSGGKSRPSAEIMASSSAANQALRRFSPGFADIKAPGDALDRLGATTAEATSRLRAQYASAVITTLESLSKSLGERQQDFVTIADKLFANTQYNTIHLSDQDLEARLRNLNRSVDELAPAVSRADTR